MILVLKSSFPIEVDEMTHTLFSQKNFVFCYVKFNIRSVVCIGLYNFCR